MRLFRLNMSAKLLLLCTILHQINLIRLFRKYHGIFKSRGGYRFAGQAIIRLLIALAIIIGIVIILQSTINDFSDTIKLFISQWKPRFVLVLFFLSESFLGLIPPDFFIAWTHHFIHEYWMLSLLAVLSYIGGLVSYGIGLWIGSSPKVHDFFVRRYGSHLHKVYQFGGVAIIFSAVFPLPFSMVCMAAGTVKYRFKKLAIYGTTRFLRFYGYAIIVYYFMK